MTLNINNAIAHKLLKIKHEEGTHLLRDTCLPASESLTRLVNEIHTAYAKRTGKSLGIFEEDEDNYPTVANLRRHYVDAGVDFVSTSHALMNTLLIEANKASSSSGGSIIMFDVSDGDNRWLIIVILTDKLGSTIDNDLNISDSNQLDLSTMRFAGRVNINKWLDEGTDRYVSFLKGGAGVSNYFQDFLGCTHAKALTKETNLLVNVVRDAVLNLDATDVQRDTVRKEVFDYLDNCATNNLPFDIGTLSNRVWPQDPSAISDVLSDPETGVTDGFVPQRRSLKGLVRFEAKNPNKWQINFERNAVQSGDVFLNDDNQLVLSNVPVEIIERYRVDFPSND